MLRLVPTLLATALFAGFVHYFYKVKLDKKLLMHSAVFAVVSYLVMHVYHQHFMYEYMTTFGDACPNGYAMVPDPSNPQQQTCVAHGSPTYEATTGFKGDQKK
jgi:hypothetical protein